MTANHRAAERRKLFLVIGTVILAAGMTVFAMAAVSAASPAKEPIANESVGVGDHTTQSVFVDAEFSENGTLYTVLYGPDGSETANHTLNGDAGETVSHQYNVSQNGTYKVELVGEPSAMDQIWVSTSEASNGSDVLAGTGSGGSGLLSAIPNVVQWALLVLSAIGGAAAIGAIVGMDR